MELEISKVCKKGERWNFHGIPEIYEVQQKKEYEII